MDEIQALTLRIQRLGQAVDWWNTAMIVALILAALAAVAVVVTTRMALVRAKDLSDAQGELDRAKDRNLQDVLKDKDVEIGNAMKAAGDANERAAGLEVEAARLRRELMHQGPRANLVAGDARKRLVDALRPLAGQSVDVRYSANTFMVNGHILQVTPMADDAVGLAGALNVAFHEAGLSVPVHTLPTSSSGEGVTVGFGAKASRETRSAAQTIADALSHVLLTVNGPSELTEPYRKRVGDDAIEPPFGDNTIVVDVLSHP